MTKVRPTQYKERGWCRGVVEVLYTNIMLTISPTHLGLVDEGPSASIVHTSSGYSSTVHTEVLYTGLLYTEIASFPRTCAWLVKACSASDWCTEAACMGVRPRMSPSCDSRTKSLVSFCTTRAVPIGMPAVSPCKGKQTSSGYSTREHDRDSTVQQCSVLHCTDCIACQGKQIGLRIFNMGAGEGQSLMHCTVLHCNECIALRGASLHTVPYL